MSIPAELPDVGVAVTFSAGLIDELLRHADLVDAIEIEPQSLWSEHRGSVDPYRSNADVEQVVADLPFRKLVHSIGLPVGGGHRHDPAQVDLLRRTVDDLDTPWFSEHLSFNHGPEGFTGFFLPPRQTMSGVEQAAASAVALQSQIGRPMAIETGVNYLRPRADELDDGDFGALVAEQASCHVLLDLHNIYCNERNGRQTMEDFVAQLDRDRVLEVHVAGGMELDGFWLDAHSGAMPTDLFARALDIVADLPRLRAITFEIYPAFLAEIPERVFAEQLEMVRELWEAGGRSATASTPKRSETVRVRPPVAGPTPDQWERDLAALVTVRDTETTDDHGLRDDPGLALLQRLSLEFRASMITTNLPRTTRLLLLALGEEVVRVFLDAFRRARPPHMFGSTEALSFADYLFELGVEVPQLDAVLRFEVAALRCRLDGETRVVEFPFDPLPMLRALAEYRLPDQLSAVGQYEIEIVGDGETAEAADGLLVT